MTRLYCACVAARRELGKVQVGRLVVVTPDSQYTYELRGSQPQYHPPDLSNRPPGSYITATTASAAAKGLGLKPSSGGSSKGLTGGSRGSSSSLQSGQQVVSSSSESPAGAQAGTSQRSTTALLTLDYTAGVQSDSRGSQPAAAGLVEAEAGPGNIAEAESSSSSSGNRGEFGSSSSNAGEAADGGVAAREGHNSRSTGWSSSGGRGQGAENSGKALNDSARKNSQKRITGSGWSSGGGAMTEGRDMAAAGTPKNYIKDNIKSTGNASNASSKQDPSTKPWA